MSDSDIDDVGKRIVNDFYNNKEICELKNNGRPLTKALSILVDRQISGLYSNITGYKPLQSILINAIRFSVLVEKNKVADAEFKKIREASDRRKNMLHVLERKLETTPSDNNILKEIEKVKDEIKLLDDQLSIIATDNTDTPVIKTHLLDLARKSYNMLLRSDKTSEKLYIAVCKYLNVKIDNDHFGYNVYNQQQSYTPQYSENRYNRMPQNMEPKKDVYVPPMLQHNYNQRRRFNNNY